MAEKFVRSATRVRSFENPEFDFQLLRSLGVVFAGGGSVGEVLTVAAAIGEPTPEKWVKEFSTMADKVEQEAARCRKLGRNVSARSLFLRASMYYRAAEYFLDLDSPEHDPMGLKSRDAFRSACPLLEPEVEVVEIPYAPIPLPGYFARSPRGEGKSLIICGGFDSSGEELYFNALGALERGFNVFFFDGPGQTGMMRLKPRLPFRPDYEAVIGPVFDYVLGREEVDPERVGLLGISFGGYLAPRAAAFDARIKALIPDSPITDWRVYLGDEFGPEKEKIPDFTSADLRQAGDEEATLLQKQMLIHMMRKFGVDSWHALLASLSEFRLSPENQARIICPVLACIGEGEGEEAKRQSEELVGNVSGTAASHTFTVTWGADAHCQVNNTARFWQVAYDWLESLFEKK
ncbi:MAG: alpha/beta fold hydrolase [PVC group bacterium]